MILYQERREEVVSEDKKAQKKCHEVPASLPNRVKFLFCLQKEIHHLWLLIVKMNRKN